MRVKCSGPFGSLCLGTLYWELFGISILRLEKPCFLGTGGNLHLFCARETCCGSFWLTWELESLPKNRMEISPDLSDLPRFFCDWRLKFKHSHYRFLVTRIQGCLRGDEDACAGPLTQADFHESRGLFLFCGNSASSGRLYPEAQQFQSSCGSDHGVHPQNFCCDLASENIWRQVKTRTLKWFFSRWPWSCHVCTSLSLLQDEFVPRFVHSFRQSPRESWSGAEVTDLLTGDGISSPQSDLLFLDKLQLTFVLETARTVVGQFCIPNGCFALGVFWPTLLMETFLTRALKSLSRILTSQWTHKLAHENMVFHFRFWAFSFCMFLSRSSRLFSGLNFFSFLAGYNKVILVWRNRSRPVSLNMPTYLSLSRIFPSKYLVHLGLHLLGQWVPYLSLIKCLVTRVLAPSPRRRCVLAWTQQQAPDARNRNPLLRTFVLQSAWDSVSFSKRYPAHGCS